MIGEIAQLFAFIVLNEQGEEEILTINHESVGFTRFIGVWNERELACKKRTADEFGRAYRICTFRRSEYF